MSNFNQIIRDASSGQHKLLLQVTDATGTPVAGQPTILIDIPTLAGLGLTNIAVGWQLLHFNDANNSCKPMKMAVLGTAPEPA